MQNVFLIIFLMFQFQTSVQSQSIKSKNKTSFKIGQSYGGGKIFYIDKTGKHGLIAASEDQSTYIKWNNGSLIAIAATSTATGTGNNNTKAIVASQGGGGYAAQLCNDLIIDGFDDWYLPSKDELNILFLNRDLVGGFDATGIYLFYWSSSETDSQHVWGQFFSSDGQQYSTATKNIPQAVRAIRSF